MNRSDFPFIPAMAGIEAATGRLGLYPDRDDLWLVHFPDGAQCSGVFTRSATRSVDIDWCRDALRRGGGEARALIVNSGNSNAFTGAAGIAKNRATTARAAALASCPETAVFLAATGVIGEPVPPSLVADALPEVWPRLAAPCWLEGARAIMTTDTVPKGAAAVVEHRAAQFQLAGVAKGSGMIAPDMATMLVFLFTDAAIEARECQALLGEAAATSFNAITVDGDTSTSDTVLLFATGAADGPVIDGSDRGLREAFKNALAALTKDLAIQIVRDGEGATKLIEISICGASSDESARRIAASIANSPLVKTAIGAGDANWGRIMMAAGKAAEPLDRDRAVLRLGDIEIARDGGRSPHWSEATASAAVADDRVCISLDAGTGGPGAFTVWTCDLTHGYIDINGSYRS